MQQHGIILLHVKVHACRETLKMCCVMKVQFNPMRTFFESSKINILLHIYLFILKSIVKKVEGPHIIGFYLGDRHSHPHILIGIV
jgi:hypothetical protein